MSGKFQLVIPARPTEEAGNPSLVDLTESSGVTATDLTAIFEELGESSRKIKITKDGVEIEAEIISWNPSAGVSPGIKGTAIADYDLGGNQDGTAGMSVRLTPIDNGDYYTFDGVGDGLYAATVNGMWEFYAKFSVVDRYAGAQVLWKDGATNGIAIGIDADGFIGVFGRKVGWPPPSITIPPYKYEDDTVYELWTNRTKVVLYDPALEEIVWEVDGDEIYAGEGSNGGASIAYGENYSPIDISCCDVNFFGGDIYHIGVYAEGELILPNTGNQGGQILIPGSELSDTVAITFEISYDINFTDNPNITDGTLPVDYWDAAGIVTWGIYVAIYMDFIQLLPYFVQLSSVQTVSMSPRSSLEMRQVVSNARNSHLTTGIIINTTDPCYRQFEIPIVGYAGAFLVFEQVFSLLGHAAALQFSEVWYQRGYDEARLEFREVITAELEEELQQLQFSVTVAGTGVAVESCDLDRSGVVTVADLTLRNFSDYNNKNVGDPVSVWWLGIEYKLILENKPLSESISQGQKDIPYIFQCVSKTAQLSEQINPSLVASRVTGSFPEGTMASDLLDFIMNGIAPWSLGVSDFPVGAIEFEDSDRGTALRQLFPGGDTLNQEWVVNTAPDGTLTINRFFGAIVPELLSISDHDKTVNCSSKSLTQPTGLLYTQVSISNYAQDSGAAGLRIEIIDNGDGTGFINGNSVPWTDNLTLDHSALSGLIIQKIGVEEVEFTDNAVEISDYSGSLSKPVYSGVSVDWLNNDSLDPVTADESGQLKTETAPGNSVGNFTAMTKRVKWEYSNDRDQVAQVVLKYGDQ